KGRAAAQPLRVVLAGRRKLPRGSRVLDDVAESLVLHGGAGPRGLRRALATRPRAGIQSLLVEGGARIHGAFIAAGLVDRVALFVAPRLLGGGVPIAAGSGLPLGRGLDLGALAVRRLGRDLLLTADVIRG